jgi:hypothetical protein
MTGRTRSADFLLPQSSPGEDYIPAPFMLSKCRGWTTPRDVTAKEASAISDPLGAPLGSSSPLTIGIPPSFCAPFIFFAK